MELANIVKAEFASAEPEDLLRSGPDVLVGVTGPAVAALRKLDIVTVFDLASSRFFANAGMLCGQGPDNPIVSYGLVPSDIMKRGGVASDPATMAAAPLSVLEGISEATAQEVANSLGVASLHDLANWPPYRALRAALDAEIDDRDHFDDPEIPGELVPRFNQYPTEKQFYSVYMIDDLPSSAVVGLRPLDGPIDLGTIDVSATSLSVRTGSILRFEQSWTARGLALGNLLHSMSLAPGESTRIAMIDWSRRQGVRTTEDISQLEALSNSLLQARSVSEVTKAVASEAQSGFSKMDANSTVSNNAYSSFGLQNPEQALVGMGVGGLIGGAGGAALGGTAGAGIGAVAGASVGAAGWGIGAVPGAILGAAGGAGVGMGTGGLVGSVAGAAAGGLAIANFGAGSNNGSSTKIDAVTTTSSTGTRDIAAQMAQNIQDRTQQHSSSSRNRKAAIVQEVRQEEHEQITSRVITNYNHMHALTMNYFEVVQLYSVKVTPRELTPCLFVPVKRLKWTASLAERFKSILLDNALSAEFATGLAWPRRLAQLTNVTSGAFTAAQRQKQQDSASEDVVALRERVRKLDGIAGAGRLDPILLPDGAELVGIDGAPAGGTIVFRLRDGRTVASTVTLEGPGEPVTKISFSYRARRIRPVSLPSLTQPVPETGFDETGAPVELTLPVQGGAVLVPSPFGPAIAVPVEVDSGKITIPREILYVNLFDAVAFGGQLPALDVPIAVRRTTERARSISTVGQQLADLSKVTFRAAPAATPPSPTPAERGLGDGLRQPSGTVTEIGFTFLWNGAEYRLALPFRMRPDRVLEVAGLNAGFECDLLEVAHGALTPELLDHLDRNSDWYTQKIYQSLGELEYGGLISQFQYESQPLVNQVDMRPVAIAGSYLVFRRKQVAAKELETLKEAVGFYACNVETIPLGTGGVFGEAVLGRANSAERLDITRFWNWQDSPIPILPPDIAPLQAGSRATDADVRPGALDPALVSNMAPQALPDPTGLGATLQTLGNGSLFRDMSGIAQTAALAQKALEEAMEGAVTTGGQNAENLRKGLDFTKEIATKIMDMTGSYANTLANAGFGALTGAAGGGGAMAAASARGGGAAPAARSVGGGGSAAPSPSLGNSNPSVAGALLNEGEKIDAAPPIEAPTMVPVDEAGEEPPSFEAPVPLKVDSKRKQQFDHITGGRVTQGAAATPASKSEVCYIRVLLRGSETGPIDGEFTVSFGASVLTYRYDLDLSDGEGGFYADVRPDYLQAITFQSKVVRIGGAGTVNIPAAGGRPAERFSLDEVTRGLRGNVHFQVTTKFRKGHANALLLITVKETPYTTTIRVKRAENTTWSGAISAELKVPFLTGLDLGPISRQSGSGTEEELVVPVTGYQMTGIATLDESQMY
jgi:hypothetical protein